MNQGREQGVIQSAGGRLIFVITLLLVAMMAARTPMDSDLWWHLRAGQVTIETGHPLVTDLFSYTRDGQSWINHSWLSQVILYGLYRLANYTGLSLWVTVLAVVSLTLVFFQMKGAAWWRSIPGDSGCRCNRSGLVTPTTGDVAGFVCLTVLVTRALEEKVSSARCGYCLLYS